MTQEKMRKVITACVSAATVLFVLLLSYLIYQWVTISAYNKRIEKEENDIANLEQTLEENKKAEEYYGSKAFKDHALIDWLMTQEKNK